ncbi:MAG TPA: hypothetical protein VLG38_07305 [Gammaproteobacteria bacterium]|nr:hypothetical protein [Gammaproteobacteria bacterium]
MNDVPNNDNDLPIIDRLPDQAFFFHYMILGAFLSLMFNYLAAARALYVITRDRLLAENAAEYTYMPETDEYREPVGADGLTPIERAIRIKGLEQKISTIQFPAHMLCEGKLMVDPVFTERGKTYERTYIVDYLAVNNNHDPEGYLVNSRLLREDTTLRKQIIAEIDKIAARETQGSNSQQAPVPTPEPARDFLPMASYSIPGAATLRALRARFLDQATENTVSISSPTPE